MFYGGTGDPADKYALLVGLDENPPGLTNLSSTVADVNLMGSHTTATDSYLSQCQCDPVFEAYRKIGWESTDYSVEGEIIELEKLGQQINLRFWHSIKLINILFEQKTSLILQEILK